MLIIFKNFATPIPIKGDIQFSKHDGCNTISFTKVGENAPKLYDVDAIDKIINSTGSARQPISTAPKDGTIIMGYWESDPDPRPQKVKWDGISQGWYTPAGFRAEDEAHWVECTPPTHWSPIN